MDALNVEKYNILARKMRGLLCWACSAGEPTGSAVLFHLGDKVKRERPLNNPHVSSDLRFSQGEYSIYIGHCAWRVMKEDLVLCCNDSDNRINEVMQSALKNLEGKKIIDITVDKNNEDMVITFQGNYSVMIFSYNQTYENIDNHTLSSPVFSITSTSNEGVIVE